MWIAPGVDLAFVVRLDQNEPARDRNQQPCCGTRRCQRPAQVVGTDDSDHGTDESYAYDSNRQRFEHPPVLAEEPPWADSLP